MTKRPAEPIDINPRRRKRINIGSQINNPDYMKKCTRVLCENPGPSLAIENFYKLKTSKDGYVYECKVCCKKKDKAKLYRKNREIPAFKICSKPDCKSKGQLQPICNFAKRGTGFQAYCKECRPNFRKSKIQFIQDLKDASGCKGCDKKSPQWSLQFAHFDRKHKNANLNKLETIEAIKKELPLGRFLCRLCHCIETDKEFKNNQSETYSAIKSRQRKKVIYDYVNCEKIKIGKCARCELKVDPTEEKIPFSYMEFDHLPGFEKIATISQMVAQPCKYTQENIRLEMGKCQLVCSECHFIITLERKVIKKKNLQRLNHREDMRPICIAKLGKLYDDQCQPNK